MQTIPVKTSSASYAVFTGSGVLRTLLPRIHKALGRKPKRIFVLTSGPIWALWSKAFLASFKEEPTVMFLAPGERYKTLTSIENLLRQMATAGADRSSLLIAFGGGIVGDVGGFVASIYMRGIEYVQVPTTLLSQVDSSVGGKTGVNLPEGKNLVGAFQQPRAVFADVDTLGTLPDRELRAGLFECVKAGIIRDAALFRYMETNASLLHSREQKPLERVITAAIRMKAAVVAEDEYEKSVRMLLNLGHTIGHAVESVTRYRKLLHGEAVGLGMVAAIELSRLRGLISDKLAARMESLVFLYGPLPPLKLKAAALVEATGRDKKNSAGTRRFVLPTGIGKAEVVTDVTTKELTAAAEYMIQRSQEIYS